MTKLEPQHGRSLFGRQAAAYNSSRPPYPAQIFADLESSGALFAGATTLDVGAGNGLASRELLNRGAAPLTLLEPDVRFAELLNALCTASATPCDTRYESFEDAALPLAEFDLVTIATAFHWLDPAHRIAKLARAITPGGCAALFWNVFQDLNRQDAFHEATRHLLQELADSPSGAPDHVPFALDKQARQHEFEQDGKFELTHHAEYHWTLNLTPAQVRSLYSGFSPIAQLTEARQEALLNALHDIAATEFNSQVQRNMTSPVYIFRRLA